MNEDGPVLLTSEENPIYFTSSPTQEDEVVLQQKYKGRCLFEVYETTETEEGKELARYIVVWDDSYAFPLTILDGLWVEGKGCVSNAVVATGTSDEIRTKYAEWFQSNMKEDQGPIGLGYDKFTSGVMSKETPVDESFEASMDDARRKVQAIFDDYLANQPIL